VKTVKEIINQLTSGNSANSGKLAEWVSMKV